MQNQVSVVFGNRQESTARLGKSGYGVVKAEPHGDESYRRPPRSSAARYLQATQKDRSCALAPVRSLGLCPKRKIVECGLLLDAARCCPNRLDRQTPQCSLSTAPACLASQPNM
jgi:hypothetical protein